MSHEVSPDLPFLAFLFLENARQSRQKDFFSLAKSLESLGKKGKRSYKTRTSLKRKNKEIKKAGFE